MKKDSNQTAPTTPIETVQLTDDTTIDDLYQQQWFAQLSPEHQALALAHQQDQFEAIPSYVERYRS